VSGMKYISVKTLKDTTPACELDLQVASRVHIIDMQWKAFRFSR
jgi:hypothetical protein